MDVAAIGMMICVDYNCSVKFLRVSADPFNLAEYVVQPSLWPAENETVDSHNSFRSARHLQVGFCTLESNSYSAH